jgi:CheY-like chemotaxis protein
MASRRDFDLMISDLGLPDGTGHDLMRQLIARKRGVKAIALSGYGMEDDVQRSRDAGFIEHLTKPVGIDRLQAAIVKATG